MSQADLTRLMNAEFDHLLNEAMRKIRHCLGQLSDDQIWQQPGPEQNSVANLVLHLAGNLQQWCVAGIQRLDDDRDRASEFSASTGATALELQQKLERVVEDAQRVIRDLDERTLRESRCIQGFDVSVLQVLFHTVPHFVGHTHQIIQVTRLVLGDAYQFEWSPQVQRSGVPL